jgi:predicted O-linked N-acetylglucosamine transferase (SPINDLY family)
VTLPGAFMRARQSAAMLAQVGVPELVARDAADYVAIAARVAADRTWREELSARIDRGAARLFDDPAPVEAFAAALLAP